MSPVLVFLLAAQSPWQGSLTLDGKPVAVEFVCAYEREDVFNDKKTRIELVIAAAPIPGKESCKAMEGEVPDLVAKDGRPRMVASLSMPGFVWDRATLYAGDKSYSYSFFASDVAAKFDGGEAGKLVGRMATASEQKVGNWPAMQLDLTLNLPYTRVVPKSPAITGAEAQRHPAAIAARKFLTAMSTGNEPAIRAQIVEAERPRFDEMMKSPEKAKAMPAMKAMAADALKLPDTSVSMRGEIAEVVFERIDPKGSSKERARFQLRQEQGDWRVTQGR